MAWDKFIKKETRERDEWSPRSVNYLEQISQDESGNWYFTTENCKHILPIQNICRVTKAQDGKEEYLVNNKSVGIIIKPTGKIKKFFRIPSVLPETLTYYAEGLVAGISRTREEVISFTIGGPGADSEFSISNYTVSIRLDDCTDIYADSSYIYVLYSGGVCVLSPAAV